MVCLINNAARVEPLKSIEDCLAEEIIHSFHINLIAPIVLSSIFIKKTEGMKIRRKIINISSGSGTYPAPDMSIYSSTKAGLDMFTRCVGAEQINKDHPVEIIAVYPGMVDMEMQRIARSEESAMTDFFKKAYTNGELQSADHLAQDIKRMIEKKFETGRLANHILWDRKEGGG